VVKITRKELETILVRCEAATSGPWQSFIEGRDHTSGSSFIRTGRYFFKETATTEKDQDFIAQARQDLPRLVAKVMRLRGWAA